MGFLGAIAALMVAVAVWLAVVHPVGGPGLVWGGNVYRSKQEFQLYLRSKGLSYRTWLNRNPGVAPWEPGRRVAKSDPKSRQAWDWKRDALLSVNAALLAAIAAALVARAAPARRYRIDHGRDAPAGSDRTSRALTVTRTGAHALGYVGRGATQLTRAALNRVREGSGAQHDVVWYASAVALTLVVGVVVARQLG